MAISFSGCATFGKKKDLEIQGLKNQVTVLESQLQSKDQEISGLREELDRAAEERNNFSQNKGIFETKSRPSNKQIQLALKNAGYNLGRIDGRIGRQTREAIKAFQKANNIPVDGKVGKQTWEALKGYLVNKVK
jgi:peptidoglycan hydrolase-like protein with peptidoglycan-binding domain